MQRNKKPAVMRVFTAFPVLIGLLAGSPRDGLEIIIYLSDTETFFRFDFLTYPGRYPSRSGT